MEDKIKGMLAGEMMGDVLGHPYELGTMSKKIHEFTGYVDTQAKSYNRFTKKTKLSALGQWTDDTEMTFSLVYGMKKQKKIGKKY